MNSNGHDPHMGQKEVLYQLGAGDMVVEALICTYSIYELYTSHEQKLISIEFSNTRLDKVLRYQL